jgi:hypothetical protein
MTKATFNNSERVDSLIGWAILLGAGGVLFYYLALNIFPYAAFFGQLLSRLIPANGGGLWGLLRMVATLAGWIVGIGALVAVQSAEAWPVLLGGSPKETRTERWDEKLFVASVCATLGYALDAFFCARFWPVLTVPMEQFRWTRMIGQVDFGNVATVVITMFGVAVYVLLWRFVRKVM